MTIFLTTHYKHPYHFGCPSSYAYQAQGYNKLCGDSITFYLTQIEDGKLGEIWFSGESCLVCKSVASVICQIMEKQDLKKAVEVGQTFCGWLAGEEHKFFELPIQLQEFAELREHPVRHKCAMTAVKTFEKSVIQAIDKVSN